MSANSRVLGSILLLAFSFPYVLAQPEGPSDEWTIRLHSRTIQPQEGVAEPELLSALADDAAGVVHALVQLRASPTVDERSELARQGVTLLSREQGTTYSAALDASLFSAGALPQGLRWAGAIRPEDKLEPALRNGRYAPYAVNDDGTLSLIVTFHGDVQALEAESVLDRYAVNHQRSGDVHQVTIERQRLDDLLIEDSIRSVRQRQPRFIPLNDSSREASSVDAVQQAVVSSGGSITYDGLSGEGVVIAVADGPIDAAHPDFAGRIGYSSGAHWHGTHVAGVLGGSGVASGASGRAGASSYRWRGIAPGVELVSLDTVDEEEGYWPSSVELFEAAVVDAGAYVSNHSYVQSCSGYESASAQVDLIVRGDAVGSAAIPARITVWSAGNSGWYSEFSCGPQFLAGYFSILAPAKNPIVVGGIRSHDGVFWGKSSHGPTLDGRLKPDVVAPACRFDGFANGVVAPKAGTSDYRTLCGTSQAAPVVSGIVALMIQKWWEAVADPSSCIESDAAACLPAPATFKAILIQTAVDMTYSGGYPPQLENPDIGAVSTFGVGPDYVTGYGMVNAEKAVELIGRGVGLGRSFLESVVSTQGEVHEYEFSVAPDSGGVKVTLAWDDEAAPTGISSRTERKLVNDLDLVLIDPQGQQHLPWVLTPGDLYTWPQASDVFKPAYPDTLESEVDNFSGGDVPVATRGVDRRNNVEQVEVEAPLPGQWILRVTGYELPNALEQGYSLVWEGMTETPQALELASRPGFCEAVDWTPWERGISISRWLGDCAYVDLHPICLYVLDCPVCRNGYCPPYELGFPGIPSGVELNLAAVNGEGVPVRENFFLIEAEPTDNYYIFLSRSSSEDEGAEEELRIPIELRAL